MDNKIIGEFLLTLRKEKNLTQSEIANLCNVSGQAVSKWERGESIPDVEILQKLSLLYDITINELLEGERRSRKDISSKRIFTLRIILLTVSLLTFFLTFVNTNNLGGTFNNVSQVFSGFQLVFKGMSGDVVYITWILLILILFQLVYLALVITKIFDKDFYYNIGMTLSSLMMLVLAVTNMLSGFFVIFPQFIIIVSSVLLLFLSKEDNIIEEVENKGARNYNRVITIFMIIYGVSFLLMLWQLLNKTYIQRGELISTGLLGFVLVAFILTRKLVYSKFIKEHLLIQMFVLLLPGVSLLSLMVTQGVNIPAILSVVFTLIPFIYTVRLYSKN